MEWILPPEKYQLCDLQNFHSNYSGLPNGLYVPPAPSHTAAQTLPAPAIPCRLRKGSNTSAWERMSPNGWMSGATAFFSEDVYFLGFVSIRNQPPQVWPWRLEQSVMETSSCPHPSDHPGVRPSWESWLRGTRWSLRAWDSSKGLWVVGGAEGPTQTRWSPGIHDLKLFQLIVPVFQLVSQFGELLGHI